MGNWLVATETGISRKIEYSFVQALLLCSDKKVWWNRFDAAAKNEP